MSRLWNAEVISWAMKAIMPELSLVFRSFSYIKGTDLIMEDEALSM
jgi:hypothetical protein